MYLAVVLLISLSSHDSIMHKNPVYLPGFLFIENPKEDATKSKKIRTIVLNIPSMLKTLIISIVYFVFQNCISQILLKDFSPGSYNSNGFFVTELNGGVVISIYDSAHGGEQWFTDGTTNGTYLLKDINPGINGSLYTDFSYTNSNLLFFTALDSFTVSNRYGLWVTDGTKAGTKKVKDFDGYPKSKTNKQGIIFENRLYFTAENDSLGEELWVSDGTQQGTKMVKDIYRGKTSSNPYNFTIFKDKLFFFANDSAHGYELWESDGTTENTKIFKDIYQGGSSSLMGYAMDLPIIDDHFYFITRRDSLESYELFRSDGTAIGTDLFIDLEIRPYQSAFPFLKKMNDSVFMFYARVKDKYNVWRSNGTLNGTYRLFDEVDTIFSQNFIATDIHPFYDKYIVGISTLELGSELYITDGTKTGTTLLKDINPGQNSSVTSLGLPIKIGNRYYFIAQHNNLGMDIWVTDGTFDSTIVFLELSNRQWVNSIFSLRDKLLILGKFEDQIGSELYYIDIKNFSSIKSLDNKLSKIYPNPIRTGQILKIETEEYDKLTLINSLGQTVLETNHSEEFKIPDNLQSGIYTLCIQHINGVGYYKLQVME